MSDDIEYNNTCEKLDSLAINVLDLMQRILNERQHLDTFLKRGFSDIAKSRYVMGSNGVSVLQINETHIVPLRRVYSEECIRDNLKIKNYKVLNGETEHTSTNVRQRFNETNVGDLLENIKNCDISGENEHKKSENLNESEKKEEHNTSQISDPLKWFGVLVPQSLKNAQLNFQESVTISAYIASLQNELDAVSNEYKRLKIVKEKLKSYHSS